MLNSAGTDGEVAVAFVVGADSAPDIRTLRVLRTSDQEFTKSVLQSLVRDRHIPLELDCRVLPEVVQQPYVFRMGKGAR